MLAAILIGVMPSVLPAQVEDRENDVLEKWLEDRDLEGLLMRQLQSRLESTSDPEKRQQVARRLANLYAEELLSGTEASEQLIKRTRDMIAVYPQFESGRLRVAMLHARYLEGEKLFRSWIEKGARAKQRDELRKSLSELDDDLSSAIVALGDRSKELFTTEQLGTKLGRAQRGAETERQQVDAEMIHCQFLAGWTSYFRALVASEQRGDLFAKSELAFREFLQLDPQTLLSDFDSRWFDFSSAWHVRALAGLAAIAVARNDESQSTYLYELLQSNAIARDSREAVIRFRFLARCYCGQYDRAMDVLRDREKIESMSREGRVRLWVTVLKTSAAMRSATAEQFALAGLTRNMAGELLVDERHAGALKLIQEQALGNPTFEACWVSGYADFWKSNQGDSAAAEKANELLLKAAEFESDQVSLADRARCRFLLASLMLNRREYQPAIDSFTSVAAELESVDPQLASEAAWRAARASIELGKRNPAQASKAWNRLERFARAWPDSPNAATARFEKLRIELRSMSPADALTQLQEVGEGDENYSLAVGETVAQCYRVWERQPSAASLDLLRQATRRVQFNEETSSLQKTRSSFLLTNALLLNSSDQALDEVADLLKRCESWLGEGNRSEVAELELLYYRWQLQQRQGNSVAALAAVSRVVELGANTRFEIPALIELAKDRDAKLAEPGAKAQAITEAIAVYQKLSDRLGSMPQQLKASANARVAFARLGELQQQAGLVAESESVFEALVESFPLQANYLRSLAIAKATRDRDAAIKIWRQLASGSDAGSELWYESKLELAKGLSQQDRDGAVGLIRQTMQLGGELPSQWQSKYDAALKEFSADGAAP